MILIETERLYLRPLDITFLNEKYLGWINDPEVIKYLETQAGSNMDDLNQYLSNVEEAKILAWAIVTKNSNNHIGNIKIDPIDFRNGYGEYGIMMGDKEYWGKGFAKEASKAIIQYCFKEINLRKINLGVLSLNHKAIKLYESLGFHIEGVYKNHKVFEKGFCDEIRMAIFK